MFQWITAPLKRRFSKDREFYKIANDIFGVNPNNIELYKLALVHRSASVFMDDGTPLNNERLEYLGDAVLEAIVSDYLFCRYPKADEGVLTRRRSKIVSRNTMNHISEQIGLDRFVICHTSGAVVQKHINGNALEAMIGALYLDQGYDKVNRIVINRIFEKHLDMEEVLAEETDYKSRLIEWSQKSHQTLRFDTTHGEGYTKTHPVFECRICIDGMEVSCGVGDSKKEAEQSASMAVSKIMVDEVGDYILDSLDSMAADNKKQGR